MAEGGECSTKFDPQENLPGSTSFCAGISKYEGIEKIGEGIFGEVIKAFNRETEEVVTLKKVFADSEGFPITALREIKILHLLKHENIVKLIEVCATKSEGSSNSLPTCYMAFEFCEYSLAGLLSNSNIKFSVGEIRAVMKQLLDGLLFVHVNKVIHGDITPANVLLTNNGVVKIAEFTLSRPVFSVEPDTHFGTLWYTSPELLLRVNNCGQSIDMWGVGCIMAEMWTRTPILQGTTNEEQLALICNLCGSITPEVWPGVEEYDLYKKMNFPTKQRRVKERLNPYVKDFCALDLIDKLLTLDPNKRLRSDEAIDHRFIRSGKEICSLRETLFYGKS